MVCLIGFGGQVGVLFKWAASAEDKLWVLCVRGGGSVDTILVRDNIFSGSINILKKNGCDDESDRILFKWDSWDGRGIFCDINVHLWDKFERNFGRVLGKWKLLSQQEMFLYSLRKNYQISHATTKNVFTMFCMFNIAFLCKYNGWLIYDILDFIICLIALHWLQILDGLGGNWSIAFRNEKSWNWILQQ